MIEKKSIIHRHPVFSLQYPTAVPWCFTLTFRKESTENKQRKELEQQGELKLTEIRNKKMEGVPLRSRASWIPKLKVLREFCSLEEEMKMFCCKNMNRLITAKKLALWKKWMLKRFGHFVVMLLIDGFQKN